MPLQIVVPDQIWCAEYPISFGPLKISTRATFVRLLDGSLWVHSPIPATQDIVQEVAAIGSVAYVIAPNRSHHLFFREFLDAFPTAQGFIAPGLEEKEQNLSRTTVLDNKTEMPWSNDFDSVFIEGLPVLNETIWFHHSTGTLILTDLLFCFGPTNVMLNRVVARILGVYEQLGMSRTMKISVRDREAFATSIAHIASWNVERVILAHDQIIENEAARKLKDAFKWLKI